MNERGGCMEIREASFSEKRQIIRQHPHTKSFLKRKGILSVAAKAGRLLGFAFVQRRKITTEPRLTEDLILVIEVFSPAERCKGIASALVGHIKEQAVAAESYQVIAYYAPDNLPSHKLWIKNQFCVTPPDPKLDRHLSSCCALYKCCVSPAHRKKGLSYEIMIVEDHPKIREELSALLRRYGYETCAPSSFDHIVEAILQEGADLILLDINLPLFDGYYICREVRKASAVPIIIVTSRDSETDELMSMNLGADDFITKPYNTQILLAHIASVLKRAYRSPEESAELSWNGVSLSLSRSAARCGDRETELSKNETRILHVLIRNRDTIVSRDVIMNELWQSNEFVDDNTLTVNINRLRKKLAEIGAPDYIVTKRGQGYTV